MRKIQALKIALLIVILAEEIKRAKKNNGKTNKSRIVSTVNKYGSHIQSFDGNGQLTNSSSVRTNTY